MSILFSAILPEITIILFSLGVNLYQERVSENELKKENMWEIDYISKKQDKIYLSTNQALNKI